MRTITKPFDTIRQAERYLGSLYNRYSYVRLINWPRFSEKGNYTFSINN